ncbi:hypothetical protein AtNW77_Chr4g0311061 [Arabidopsis thaliana]|uniref:Gag1-like clamp domain-containing protein n=1 Tax=Arabidopsis thaliana TaxID=3702 RepID=A0A1P8B7K7_ARATH|nr:uncharacterized protein AT4G32342 [Arabidopsis thaliana]ANM67577.1 hypothetical protein AT4G32342 [Arabidopsis thaliana]|eukprot:NP_001329396.1 hypothetical protein AT4G32342 [Arabidopsis thaliana]
MCSCYSFLLKLRTQFSKKRCCSFFQFPAAYFQTLPFWLMESLRSNCKTLINSINCFGCCNRERRLVVEVDEPSKGLKIQGKIVKKDSASSDDFWSTSTCDMDHNITIQSQSSNPPFDPQCSTSNSTEFVNHGLILWNHTRQQWRECLTRQQCLVPEPAISWNSTYDSLLSTNKLFPQPIPLKEMVHFLVDVWEEEGLYI